MIYMIRLTKFWTIKIIYPNNINPNLPRKTKITFQYRAIAVDSGKRTHTGDNGEDVSENGPIEVK